MAYRQNLKSELSGYRLARWHMSGKLWISEQEFCDRESCSEYVANKNELIADLGYGIQTRYFVWHADMLIADLESYKAEMPANKIK